MIDHEGKAKLDYCPGCTRGTLLENCPNCGADLVVPPMNWCTECGKRITILPVRVTADGNRHLTDLVDEPDAKERLELEKGGKNWLDARREQQKLPEGHQIVYARGEQRPNSGPSTTT